MIEPPGVVSRKRFKTHQHSQNASEAYKGRGWKWNGQNQMLTIHLILITTSRAEFVVIGAHLCSLSRAIIPNKPYFDFIACFRILYTFENMHIRQVSYFWFLQILGLGFENFDERNLTGANFVPVKLD